MTLKFHESGFNFLEGEEIPEHIDGFPREEERDLSKIWLEGEDTFSREYYTLAINIDNLATAEKLQEARLRHLEEVQPTESSGGQGGIQDHVYIRQPEV